MHEYIGGDCFLVISFQYPQNCAPQFLPLHHGGRDASVSLRMIGDGEHKVDAYLEECS